MGLRKQVKLKMGLEVPDAYTYIGRVIFKKDGEIVVRVRTFKDKADRDKGESALEDKGHPFIADAKDIKKGDVMAWAYGKLKELKEFEDAEDL